MQHHEPHWTSRTARIANRSRNIASWSSLAVFYAMALPVAAVALFVLMLVRRV